jgi:type IV pilus assembly protein PilM
MAENQAVWGIEIGQAGLKAIRLQFAEAAGQAIAMAFDYVPHPKLLSQPDASPDELIRQALETFLSRNKLGSDLVAISVPGQTALAKFIQLPPVEASRVAEIIKYEARQQIPFALEDVEWDFQTLGGGAEESGFLIDAEVGLFAMKKEQVRHHLKPFLDRKVEVELVQIAPLGLYNFLCYDRLGLRVGAPVEQEDYTIVLDMGADATTLLVTNGKKIWIRNVPIGGNHFTRALTKEMKLTFAKAEHLKCNATKAPDPRAVFQALRPVFNDYVSEIQRSIGFFSSVNRAAKVGRLVGVGNGFKLAGLQKFLQQNLQYEVDRVDNFHGLVGDHVLTAPLFQDNLLTFAVPYGLALQTLKLTDIRTSLLPREITVARTIRRKKPWAVATAATLLCGMAASTAGYGNVWHSVSTDRFGEAEKAAKAITDEVGSKKGAYSTEEGRNTAAKANGEKLVAMLPTRDLWLEVYKAINECQPRDEGEQLDQSDIEKLNRISIESITSKKHSDLSEWFNALTENQKASLTAEEAAAGPSGPGYVFTLTGRHYHNEPTRPRDGQGHPYVKAQLIENLRKDVIVRKDPLGSGAETQTDVRRLGISHVVQTYSPPTSDVQFWPNGKPGARSNNLPGPRGFNRGGPGGFLPGGPPMPMPGASPMPFGGPPMPGAGPRPPGAAGTTATTADGAVVKTIKLTLFTVQFAWKPTLVKDRKSLEPAAPADGSDPAATPEGAPATDPAAAPPAAATDPAATTTPPAQ